MKIKKKENERKGKERKYRGVRTEEKIRGELKGKRGKTKKEGAGRTTWDLSLNKQPHIKDDPLWLKQNGGW